MNWYYVAAIIFGGLSAYFGYLGSSYESKADSEQQTTKIESQLKQLGNKIESLASGESNHQMTSSELSGIQKEYNAIAESFYKNLPLELEQQKSRNSSKAIGQLEKSRRIEPYIRRLELAANQLVGAFNKHRDGSPISVRASEFPTNVFEGKRYQVILSFANSRHWGVRLSRSSQEALQLEFTPITRRSRNQKDGFDWDLSVYIALWLSDDQSSFSLRSAVPREIQERILIDLPGKDYAMDRFDDVAKTLLERIVKYELLQETLNP